MLLAIAWRNLWRNAFRTSITLVAVAGSLTVMLIMYGSIHSMTDRMLEGMTGTYIGHVQIHEEGFRSKRGTAKSMTEASSVLAAVRETEGVEAATGRVYGFAHATLVRGDDEVIRSGEGETIGSPVISLLGIDPEHELQVTDLAEKVRDGHWIQNETDVVIGSALAKRIKAQVGDALLPTVVDQTGATRGPWAVSDDVPRVVGIARTGINEFDHRMVFMSREYLAKLMGMENEIHEVSIRSTKALELEPVVEAIEASVAEARQGAGLAEHLPVTTPLAIGSEATSSAASVADDAPDGGVQTPPPPILLRLVGVGANLEIETEGGSNSERLVAGTFLERAEHIVLSQSLAKALSVSPGDRVEVTVPVECGDDIPAEECPPSQEPFVVAGVLGDSEELLDGRFGIITSSTLVGNIGGLAPSVMVELDEEQQTTVAGLLREVRGAVQTNDEVLAWYDLSPTIRDMLVMMESAPAIMLFIVFFGVALVIVNTLLMSTFERTREIGLMRALGMKGWRVVAMVLLESALLGIVGAVLGVALGSGIVGYWSVYGMNIGVFQGEQDFEMMGITMDPIWWPRLEMKDIWNSAIPVVILTTLAGLWPAIRAARFQPTDALRQD